MEEHKLYKPIGEWLLDNTNCEDEDYFLGYTTEPEIQIEGTGTRRPDVAGVEYESSGNTKGSQNFHHHIVEVKSDVDPGTINTLIGQIETARYYIEAGNVAADTVSYYIAVPTTDVPPELSNQAAKNGIGILILESIGSNENDVLVRQKKKPTPVSTDRTGVLSNSDQASKGNFRRAVEKTAILKKLMEDSRDPERFFEEEIKPEQEDYNQRRNKKNFLQYIKKDSAQEAAEEILDFFENIEQVVVSPPSSNIKKKPSIRILNQDDETICILTPQNENFKIKDAQGDLLFRITSREDIYSSVDETIETIVEVKEWIRENLL